MVRHVSARERCCVRFDGRVKIAVACLSAGTGRAAASLQVLHHTQLQLRYT